MEKENKFEDPLYPHTQLTDVFEDGKSYTIRTKYDSNGNIVYVGKEPKLFGIF